MRPRPPWHKQAGGRHRHGAGVSAPAAPTPPIGGIFPPGAAGRRSNCFPPDAQVVGALHHGLRLGRGDRR